MRLYRFASGCLSKRLETIGGGGVVTASCTCLIQSLAGNWESFPIHAGRIHELRFIESTPVVVSASEDGEVVLFDTRRQAIVERIKVTRSKLFSVCVLDRAHLAVAGSDNVIRIVNVTLGRVSQQLNGHTGSVASLDSSGSLLFSGGYDATLRRWQLTGIGDDRERIAEVDKPIDR